MCPPAQMPTPTEIGSNWTDEQIFSIVLECHQGFRLPNNVLADSCPYQYEPSNLPEGIWYWEHSNGKKESVFGFWKAKGEACEIYANSLFSGWRATLEYFEGQSPRARKTDWIIQEYSITLKEPSDKNSREVSRSLCRIFLCHGSSSENDMCSNDCKLTIRSKECNSIASVVPKTDTTSKDVNLVASFVRSSDTTSEQHSTNETEAKKGCDNMGFPPLVDRILQNSPLQEVSEIECISTGDFLELNDLEDDPESHSSSSQNSSCPSNLSDECFDSLALLRDLEENDVGHTHMNLSTSKYSFNTSVRLNDAVILPSSAERVVEYADEHILETGIEGTSRNSDPAMPSSSSVNDIATGEKKPTSASKHKRLKMYFCLAWL